MDVINTVLIFLHQIDAHVAYLNLQIKRNCRPISLWHQGEDEDEEGEEGGLGEMKDWWKHHPFLMVPSGNNGDL